MKHYMSIKEIYLSKDMQDCLKKMKEVKKLIKLTGGFWTGKDVKTKLAKGYPSASKEKVPEWYFGTNTIKSLLNRNLIKITKFDKYKNPISVELI